jgi:hypothetical protein
MKSMWWLWGVPNWYRSGSTRLTRYLRGCSGLNLAPSNARWSSIVTFATPTRLDRSMQKGWSGASLALAYCATCPSGSGW